MTCKMVGEVILVLGSLQNHAAIVDLRGGGQCLSLHRYNGLRLAKDCD